MSSQNFPRPAALQASSKPSIFQVASSSQSAHANDFTRRPLAISKTVPTTQSLRQLEKSRVQSPDVSKVAVMRRWNKEPGGSNVLFSSLARQSDRTPQHFASTPHLQTTNKISELAVPSTSDFPSHAHTVSVPFARFEPNHSPPSSSIYHGSSSPSHLVDAYTHASTSQDKLGPSQAPPGNDTDFARQFTNSRKNSKIGSYLSTHAPEDVSGFLSRITEWKEGLDHQLEVNASLQSQVQTLTEQCSSQKKYIDSLKAEQTQSASTLLAKETLLRQQESTLQREQETLSIVSKELEAVKADHAEASRCLQEERKRVESTKTKLKQKVQSLIHDHSVSELALRSMKSDYDALKNFMENAAREMQSIKASSSEALEASQALLDQDEKYARSKEIRSLLADFQDSCSKSQQVNDFLRDKLQDSGLQLIEAKERVSDLEAHHKHSEEQLERSTEVLTGVQSKLQDMIDSLLQKNQTLLQEAAEVTAKLQAAEARNLELASTMEEQCVELAAQRATASAEKSRGDDLSAQLVRIDILHSQASRELADARQQIENLSVEANSLRNKLCIQDEQKLDLRDRLKNMEQRLDESLADNKSLHAGLSSLTMSKSELETALREAHSASQEAKHTIASQWTELESYRSQNRALATELSQLKPEASAFEMEVRKSVNQLSVLQERFDAQTITLRLTKEESGNLQERLMASECSKAALSESIKKLESDLTSRDTKILSLRTQINQGEQILAKKTADLREALAQRDAEHIRAMELSEQRFKAQEKRAILAEQLVDSLKAHVDRVQSEITVVEEQNEATIKSPNDQHAELVDEIENLRTQLEVLNSLNTYLKNQAATLPERYDNGVLSSVERDFINTLMKQTSSLNEQEMVSKSNELHRKDNVIASLTDRIQELESSLARALAEKKRERDTASVVDLNMWLAGEADEKDLNHASPSIQQETGPRASEPASKKVKTTLPEGQLTINPAQLQSTPPIRTFGDLAGDSDLSDEDTPLASKITLGKRVRASSPVGTEEPSKPVNGRRTRTNARKNDQAPIQTKTKTRRR